MTASFRVLHVVGGSEFGGIAPYIASLVKMTHEHGGDAKVLVTAPRVVHYFQERGIDTVQLHGIDRAVNPIRDLAGLTRLIAYLTSHKYTIVHTHTSKGGVIGRASARAAAVPVIIHSTQGYAFKDYAHNHLEKWLFYQLEKGATSCCDFIISANQADYQLAVELGIAPPDKIVKIPNAVDIAAIDAAQAPPDLRQSLGMAPDRKIVGAIARLSTQKGLEYFLEAIPDILRIHLETQFLIVGEGPLRSKLQARADQMGLGPTVIFTGFRSDWLEILQLMDVFVMPSLWEGLPMTLLGAMATARPVVATRIKGITDVCGDSEAMILVQPHSSAALTQAILLLLDDPLRARALGCTARRRVEEEYSEPVMNARIWNVYADTLERKLPGWRPSRYG